MYAHQCFLLLLPGIAVGVVALCKAMNVNFVVLQQIICSLTLKTNEVLTSKA